MDTTKVNRVEVIDHSKSPFSEEYGRVYTFWNEYDEEDAKDVSVVLDLQDDGRTLKIFIRPK